MYNLEKDSLFNKWCWENWISTCKRVKLHPYLTLISYKLPMDYRPLEENIGEKLDFNLGNGFFEYDTRRSFILTLKFLFKN